MGSNYSKEHSVEVAQLVILLSEEIQRRPKDNFKEILICTLTRSDEEGPRPNESTKLRAR